MSAIDRHAVVFATLLGAEEIAAREGHETSVRILQRALDQLIVRCSEFGGEVGNVVGGELLCLFTNPDAALNAACRMQQDIHGSDECKAPGLSLTIGMHHGVVYRKDGDVFGDSINTAARVKAEGRPRQILVTREFNVCLHAESASILKPFDRLRVKGKAEEITLMQAVWEPADLNSTSVMASMINSGYLRDLAADHLDLTLDGEHHQITSSMTPVNVGRSKHCEIRVQSDSASRLHCRIDHRRGKFVLTDLSTNGTHLVRSDGSETILHREEAVLTGNGRFALGEPADSGGRWTLDFTSH